MNYPDLVLSHFFDPKNVGIMTDEYPIIGIGRAGSDSVGEKVELYVGCNRQGEIKAVRYKVYGNPYMIAAMSVLSEKISELSLIEIQSINYLDLIKQLSIPLTKQHCALLAIDALQAATAQVYTLMR